MTQMDDGCWDDLKKNLQFCRIPIWGTFRQGTLSQ